MTPPRRRRSTLARASLVAIAALLGIAPERAHAGAPNEQLGDLRAIVADGRYAEAETAARALLTRVEAAQGADSLAAAQVLDVLVEALWRGGKATEAEARALGERALALKEKALGGSHLEVAASASNLAILHAEAGRPAEAGPLQERALRIREAELGPEHPDVAATLNALAILAEEGGDSARATALHERALAIREKAFGPHHPSVATSLNNLASVLSARGDLLGAKALYERALAIREKSLGPGHPQTGSSLSNMGALLRDLGDYAGAKALQEHALVVWEAALGPEHPDVAHSLYNLAIVLDDTGDYATAKMMHERALSIRERALGADHPDVASSLQDLGVVFEDMGEAAAARQLVERSLAIREKAFGPDDSTVAASLHLLARLRWQAGDAAGAKPILLRSLAIREEADDLNVGLTLTTLGGVLRDLGDHAGARKAHERALEFGQRVFGPQHPEVADSLSELSLLACAEGDAPRALELALRAEEIGREHVRLTSRALAQRQALRYAATRTSGLDVALSVAASGRLPGSGARAWDAVVKSRAFVLDEIARRQQVVADAARIGRIAQEYASASQRLANLTVRGPADNTPERYRKVLDDARREKERLEQALAGQSVPFRDDQARSRLGLAEVTRALPAGEALVAFVRYDRHEVGSADAAGAIGPRPGAPKAVPSYVALVLRGGEQEPAFLPLGPARSLDGLVARWREQAALADGSEAACREAGDALRRAAWDPVVSHVGESRRAFIVPDGPLHLVGFAGLPAGAAGYLAEVGPSLHVLSAERDLVPSQAAPPRGESLLALGGPTFDGPAPAAPRGGANAEQAMRGETARCAGFASLSFGPLPGAEREAAEIAGSWAAHARGTTTANVVQLLRGGATESAFKAAAPGHRVLHLATHGFFLGGTCEAASGTTRGVRVDPRFDDHPAGAPGENPLLLSGLALAGANRRELAGPAADDGILTSEEIASLDLSGLEWAVLSACDTGLGDIAAGEGVMGLRRAFQVAGARTVIMSLWSVDDEATLQWMRELYRGRLERKLDTSDCVREASLSVLRDRREKGLSTHPFHWAGFVAAGDWR